MEKESQLATVSQEPSVAHMLAAFIEKGITEQNVNAFGQLLALRERMEDREAEKQFAAAFVALQKEMPVIQAVKPVPDKHGVTKYKYAPYEDIMEQIRPLLQKHGFAVTFSSNYKDGRIIQTCTLQHIGGHKRENQFMARVGSGPPGSSEAQGDGAASTYAKRFALCDALNIVCERDNDARIVGEPITPEQAQFLRDQVELTGSDEAKFLAFAQAESFEEIGSERYEQLKAVLAKKPKVR